MPLKTDRVDAQVAQRRDQLGVHDATEDRGRDLERGGIGDPQAAFEPALDAQPGEPLGHALAAAVDDHHGPLPGDGRHVLEDMRLVRERRAAELHHDDLDTVHRPRHVVYSEFSRT